jgi:hypothetical protein
MGLVQIFSSYANEGCVSTQVVDEPSHEARLPTSAWAGDKHELCLLTHVYQLHKGIGLFDSDPSNIQPDVLEYQVAMVLKFMEI